MLHEVDRGLEMAGHLKIMEHACSDVFSLKVAKLRLFLVTKLLDCDKGWR